MTILTLRLNAQTVTLTTITPPCDSNGVIVATFTGLTLPARISWSTGTGGVIDTLTTGTTDTLFGFMGGTLSVYGVTISDSTLHASNTTSAFVNVPFGISSVMTPGVCPGLGSESATTAGGTSPFSYEWINTTTNVITSTTNPGAMPEGYYNLKATDAAGCFVYLYNLYVSVNLDFSIDSTIHIAPAVCPGMGSATVVPTGGTGTFTYNWTNMSGVTVGTTNPISLPSGNYHVTATDGSGCSETRSINIYTVPDFTFSIMSTPVVCPATASATATVTGGTSPITYSWTNSAGTVIGTTNSISGITVPGNYNLTVSDGAGCSSSQSVTITINPDFLISSTTTSAICPGLGSATAVIAGGTSPFTYKWINTSGTTLGTTSPMSLPGGRYDLVVTDALGCTSADDSVFISIQPDFTATVSVTPANCTNGIATANITGGTAPFSYAWSNGATSSSISSLIAGTYYVSITDALGCSIASIPGDVVQAVTITVIATPTPTTCLASNGIETGTYYGGTPPYSFLWNNGDTTQTISGLNNSTYYLTVTDVNGCTGTGHSAVGTIIPISITPPTITASACSTPTGSANIITIAGGAPPYSVVWFTTPMQTGYTAVGLAPGDYEYQVIDAGGCVKYSSVHIPPLYTIGLSFTQTTATCLLANGLITASPSGGVGPYTYTWSGSSATTSTRNVTSGSYYVTVTDAHGCSASGSDYVPTNSPLSLGISTTPASCIFIPDGSITATAIGGIPPYNYSMGGSSSGSVTINSLATNNYSISVSDAAGCTAWNYTNVGYNASDSTCYCTIKGTVFNDYNNNCIQDPGEPGINAVQIHCTGYEYTYTDVAGFYSMKVPSGPYFISEEIPGGYSLSSCQSNIIPYTAIASAGCNTVINFADTLIPVPPISIDSVHDISVCTWDYNKPIPGFSYSQITVIHNNGAYTEPSVIASYWADGTIYAPSFVPSGYYSGAPYWYNTSGLPSLAPGGSASFYMNYFVPASVPLGTILVFKDTVSRFPPMSNWLNDATPWNNVDYFNPYTVGSYDPNFKEVQPKGYDAPGYITYSDSVLQYMVHFQNVGTYEAQNVVVRDTLDPHLDWTTLSPVYMDHKGTVDMDEQGRVTFTFNDIDLPPASSEPFTSNGMLSYTIKTKRGLPLGTQFKNKASIYFDFNPPIITNTTLNTLSWPQMVNNVNKPELLSSFSLYPNPADGVCYATINSDIVVFAEIRIIDITAKTMVNKTVSLQKGQQIITLDISQLNPGVYFVSLYGLGSPQTKKLVILK